jgi:hypothetical protein
LCLICVWLLRAASRIYKAPPTASAPQTLTEWTRSQKWTRSDSFLFLFHMWQTCGFIDTDAYTRPPAFAWTTLSRASFCRQLTPSEKQKKTSSYFLAPISIASMHPPQSTLIACSLQPSSRKATRFAASSVSPKMKTLGFPRFRMQIGISRSSCSHGWHPMLRASIGIEVWPVRLRSSKKCTCRWIIR